MSLVALIALVGVPAQASLNTFKTYSGAYAVSTDGCGSTTPGCSITASVPVGATVANAYLYSSLTTSSSTAPAVTLNATAVTFGPGVSNPNGLTSFRADVTSIVAPVINGGPGGTYTFAVTENPSSTTDGEALVVVYSLGSLPTATVAVLDGFSAVGGDTTHITFSTALHPAAPGFFAEMRIGDGFSCCGQASNITVNGTLITANAGNNDDSKDATLSNGNLITVGGWNDPFSPLLPDYPSDHERYDLTPEVADGSTAITVNTTNPSGDDNIFLEVFFVSGVAAVNGPPPTTPVPNSWILMLVGLAAGGFFFGVRRFSLS